MRKLIDGYYRLLDWLLAASVGILIIPVTVQIVSRYTELFPHYIWTEEMARFLFIWMVMLGAIVGVRDASHFEVDVWPELSARPNALLLHLVRHQVRAIRLEPELGIGRNADDLHLRRMAARGLHLGNVPR